jgi:hypothetical protein
MGRALPEFVREADRVGLDPVEHDVESTGPHHPFQTVIAILTLE